MRSELFLCSSNSRVRCELPAGGERLGERLLSSFGLLISGTSGSLGCVRFKMRRPMFGL